MSSISLNNLKIGYKKDKKIVLQIDKLEILSGHKIAFFGPNHVGKSTLLKFLSQATKARDLHIEGEVLYEGKLYDSANRNPYISYIPQEYARTLLPWYGIEKNLCIPLLAKDLSQSEIDEKVGELCSNLGFNNLKELFEECGFYKDNELKKPMNLSGGQQQRLVILRSLIAQPPILVMDEPFSALDMYGGADFVEAVEKFLEKFNITTILVSHDLKETINFADVIVFLKRGSNIPSTIDGVEPIGEKKSGANLSEEDVIKLLNDFTTKYEI